VNEKTGMSRYGKTNGPIARRRQPTNPALLFKKDFERGLRAILIQEKHTTENIDSRNCLLGVKNCTLTVSVTDFFNSIDP
jgi:hypothetical protein